jgi:hypothetical protein
MTSRTRLAHCATPLATTPKAAGFEHDRSAVILPGARRDVRRNIARETLPSLGQLGARTREQRPEHERTGDGPRRWISAKAKADRRAEVGKGARGRHPPPRTGGPVDVGRYGGAVRALDTSARCTPRSPGAATTVSTWVDHSRTSSPLH